MDPEDITVTLVNLNNYSVDILANFHLVTSDAKVELENQQVFLLHILQTAEKMKIEIAYPTQKTLVQNITV